MFHTLSLGLRSAAFGAFLAFYSALMGFLVLVVAPFDKRRAYGFHIAYARGILSVAGAKLKVSGTERLPDGPAVIVANHRSQLDPVALIAALPERQIRWIAKKELGRIPFFGWGLRAAGHILIDRRNSPKAIASLVGARGVLEHGFAIVLFPEGTRSTQAGMLPFKKGGFHLAVQTGFPLIPVAVRGSGVVLPKHSAIVHPGVIHVDVLDVVPTQGRTVADVQELMTIVRRRIESALAEPPDPAPGTVGFEKSTG